MKSESLKTNRSKVTLLILVLVGLSFWSGCFKPKWQDFVCGEGGYKVSMPQLPERMPRVIKTAIGPVEVIFHNKLYKKVSFISGYVDYPKNYVKGTTADSVLSGARDGGVAEAQAILEDEKDIKQGDYPGRQITMKSKDGKERMHSRIFLAGQRFYQAMIIVPTDGEYDGDVERFLESFKITQQHINIAGKKAPWGEYKSKQGKFAILTAGTPSFRKEPLSTKYGFLELSSYHFEDDGINYVISHVDYEEENVKKLGTRKLFDSVQAGAEQKASAKAKRVQKVMASGFDGREFYLEPQKMRFEMRLRLFMVHHRLYQLVVVYPKNAPDKTNVEVFLKSLRIHQ